MNFVYFVIYNTFTIYEGNNLIGINVCDYRSVPVVFQMMRDNVNPAASVELINNEFHVGLRYNLISF